MSNIKTFIKPMQPKKGKLNFDKKKERHIIMLDSTEFIKKPTMAQEEAMNMKQANLTIKELVAAVEKGQCFNPCLLDKDNKFVSSSLVAIEVNNDALKQKKYGKITVKDFLEEALISKVKPVLVYKALNTTKKFDRFVAVFKLDKTITDLSLYIDAAYNIKKCYPYADVVQTAMVYGAKEIVYMENNVVAPETTGIRLATTEEVKEMAKKVPDTKPKTEIFLLHKYEEVAKEIELEDTRDALADIKAAEEFEKEQELLATMTDDEKFEHEMAKLDAEIEGTDKLVVNNKTVFDLKEIREQKAKENNMKHKVLLDTKAYSMKPTSLTAGSIQKRLPNCVANVTIEELANALVSGRTFKPVYMTGKTQDTFVSASLVVIDIDNKGSELEQYGYVSTQDFIRKTETAKYKPAIVYTTFSHTKSLHKYRAVFQLNRTVTNLNELAAILAEIKNEYPFADAKVSPVHLIYGGKELILLDKNAVISPVVEYDTEATSTASRAKATEITKVVAEKRNYSEETLVNNLSVLKGKFEGTTIDIVDSFDWINKNIPMTVALGYELDTRFRCIYPEHTDNNPSARISETIDGQQNYICSCGDTYQSLIDVVAKLLNKNKVLVQHIIADAVGITVGSKYQKDMRLLVADVMANTDKIIKKDSLIYKYMYRSNLHGLYNLVQQFASSHITNEPLGAPDKITFFMSRSQIREKMVQFNMKGVDRLGYKINALKELGLVRALSDEEINPEALTKAKAIQNKMILENPRTAKYMKRIEYYELSLITPEGIKKAEDIIQKQKELGVKRNNINSTRRALAMGEEFAASINVQMDVSAKLNSPKIQKELDKVVGAAQKLIAEQGYFTEDQIRKAYDPNRKKRKEAAVKVINDAIPFIIKTLGIKKDRVKKSTKTIYSIPDNIKTNTTIYC